jgi:putative endonuclease
LSREKGTLAEDRACSFLEDFGFVIVQRNFYSRFGEIDIIAKKDSVYHFVEVKSSTNYEDAISQITPSKLSKIVRTTQIYLKKFRVDSFYQFDAVIVTPLRIEFVENITLN